MGREFEAERKHWPSTSFLVTAALFHVKLMSNRNQVQTLRFVFNPEFPCSIREYMPANDKRTELK